ncbi:DUF5709 domain-containing protein [Nocardiopsis sp. frass2]
MAGTDDDNEFGEPADDPGLLPPDESLDADELGDDADGAGYSPLDFRSANLSWGLTPREAHTSEPLSARLDREVPDERADLLGDGIGDTTDTDGELIDDQVGSLRAGRLVFADPSGLDPAADHRAIDIGIDGGAASAEEAAVHIVIEDDRR